MQLRSLLGWGVVIYAVLNLVWTGLVANGFSGNVFARIIMIGTLVALTALATRSLRILSERDTFLYAIGWAIIAAVLDIVITVPRSGWVMFDNWNVWVGYGLLVLVPLVVTAISKRSTV